MRLAKVIDFLRRHIKAVIRSCYCLLVALVLLELVPGLVDKEHAHTAFERFPAFWAAFGFFGCLLIFIVSKTFGSLGITQREDYYDE